MDNPNNSDAGQRSLPASPQQLNHSRLVKMLGQVWLHYPNQDLPAEAWKSLSQDFLKALSGYPLPVVERAIDRGLKVWKFRPNVAEMVEQCERALRDMPKPERTDPANDWKKNTLGGYTADRRKVLADNWLRSHRTLIEEAKADGWYFALWHCVEDGANILAQTEWHQRTNPGWRPPPWHQINVDYDPVRGWSIFIAPDKLARWRSSRNGPVPIKGHAGRDFGDVVDEVVRDAESARARAAE
jgi:hypothetical protein